MNERAYVVTHPQDAKTACYVMADTPINARKRARVKVEPESLIKTGRYAQLHCSRVPSLDSGITEAKLVRAGRMWTGCPGCGQELDISMFEAGYDIYYGKDERAYCSKECWVKAGSRYIPKIYTCVCLYDY